MPEYSLNIKQSAQKELDSLDDALFARIDRKILPLADNPRPPGCKKLKGHKDLWRIRIGDYRVVYVIDDTNKADSGRWLQASRTARPARRARRRGRRGGIIRGRRNSPGLARGLERSLFGCGLLLAIAHMIRENAFPKNWYVRHEGFPPAARQ